MYAIFYDFKVDESLDDVKDQGVNTGIGGRTEVKFMKVKKVKDM